MSLPEVLLWQHLRREPEGIKFRRQHSIGNYYLDFFVASLKLRSRSMASRTIWATDPDATKRGMRS